MANTHQASHHPSNPQNKVEAGKQPEVKTAEAATEALHAQAERAEKTAEKSYENWRRLFDEQYSQVARWQNYGLEQARASLDQSFKAVGDATAYAIQYSSDWQRIAFDWARRAAQLMVPAT